MRLPAVLFLLAALGLACAGSDNDGGASSATRSPDPESTRLQATGLIPERALADRPDDAPGPQVHLVYALPAGGTDRRLDIDGTIRTSFEAAQRWLSGETGGRRLALDTFGGEPDISALRLSRDDAGIQAEEAFAREAIEAELIGAGFDAADKLYLVYYDGGSTYACGSGAWPPVIEGSVAVLFLNGMPLGGAVQCGENEFAADADSPDFWEFVAVHEIMHTLGFVAECAPNETMSGHIAGPPNDLMYEGEEETGLPKTLDPGHDDYFEADNPGCPDLAASPYLAAAP